MRWAGHAVITGEMRNVYDFFFLLENLNGRHHLEDLGVDGSVIVDLS
jgi:hypothetical protein